MRASWGKGLIKGGSVLPLEIEQSDPYHPIRTKEWIRPERAWEHEATARDLSGTHRQAGTGGPSKSSDHANTSIEPNNVREEIR